jgi:rhodanese-related sulfurtransferase
MKPILIVVILAVVALATYACSKGGKEPFRNLTPDEFEKLITEQKVQLLDVRTAEEYAEAHLSGSIHIDVLQDSFAQKVTVLLAKDTPVAVYCKSGRRSRNAAEVLVKKGYTVYNLDSGITGWMSAGKAVVK